MDLESEIPLTSLKLFNGNLHIIKKSNQDEFAVTEIVALAPKPITRPNFQKSKKIIYCIILEVENIRKIKFDDKRYLINALLILITSLQLNFL